MYVSVCQSGKCSFICEIVLVFTEKRHIAAVDECILQGYTCTLLMTKVTTPKNSALLEGVILMGE